MKDALLVAGVVAAGFIVGYLWGRGTREAMPEATSTQYADGRLVITVDVYKAARMGFQSMLG